MIEKKSVVRSKLCEKYVCLLGAVAVMLLTASCGGKGKNSADYERMEGMIWNTEFHITYKGDVSLKDSVLQVLDRVGASLNVFDDTSLVSRVNRQDTTAVDTDFIRVYAASRNINNVTDGAFDPTLGPLIRAWGFGKGHVADADTARIDSIMAYVGIDKTHIYMDSLVKDDVRTEFNFSAIAKGYGCDAVGEMFSRNGVDDWLVEIGGEISVHGVSPSGEKWRVSVDRPVMNKDSVLHDSQCVVAFTDMGMATSGNYRNFLADAGGKSYGHTISTVTGRPVATDVLSATVLARTAMEADALATAFMAMGSEKSKKLNKSLRLPVMLILSDSTIWTSSGFEKLMCDK